MKPHPRIRKTIKWGGAVVTVLMGVVWIGSTWWRVDRYSQGSFESIEHGSIMIVRGVDLSALADPGWRMGRASKRSPWAWWFHYDSSPSPPRGGLIPMWFPTSMALAVTATAWRLDTRARRRALLNLCAKCGYDRTGLAAGAVCPECGRLPT